MLRPALALVAAVALLALPSPASAEPDPMVGAPTVGECFDLTLAEAMAPSLGDEPVDCAEEHTAIVTAVAQLPANVSWSSSPERIGRIGSALCAAGRQKLVGRNDVALHRSQYTSWLFEPTAAQKTDGARWLSCALSIADDRGPVVLPATLPRLGQDLPDSVARCVTKKFAYTTCADVHEWRSTYGFFGRGELTESNAKRAAGRHCPSHVSSPRRFLYSTWDVFGAKFGVICYAHTRR